MTTYYVQPKVTGYTGGTGLTQTSAFSLKQAYDAIQAGTIKAGDQVAFCGASGQFTLGDRSEFAYAGAINSAFSSGTNTGAGCIFGDHNGTPSKASGIWFNGRGDGAQSVFNMAGGRTASERQICAVGFRGEGMVISGFNVRAPDFDYLANVTGSFTTATQAETVSYENLGVYVGGGGNIFEDNVIDCSSGVGTLNAMSRYGVQWFIPNESMGANYGKHLRTIIRRNRITGAFHNYRIDPGGGPGGGGEILRNGSELWMYFNTSLAPVFGRQLADALGGYNALSHGGHISISGAYYGRGFCVSNYLQGDCQDAIDLIGAGMLVGWNTIEDIRSVNPTIKKWNGSAWVNQTMTSRDGNGIKMGFSGMSGTAPTTWLGIDGVNGGVCSSMESNNQCIGNKVRRTSGNGITTNNSNGHFIAYNECIDTELPGIVLFPEGSRGTMFVMNNYLRLAQTNVGFVGAIDVQAPVLLYEFNNVYDSGTNAAARSAYDANYRNTTARVAGGKNVYVNGRRQVFAGSSYTGTSDINGGAAQSIAGYVDGAGFPAGHALQGLADSSCLRLARTAGMNYDANRRRIVLPNNPGPFTRIA